MKRRSLTVVVPEDMAEQIEQLSKALRKKNNDTILTLLSQALTLVNGQGAIFVKSDGSSTEITPRSKNEVVLTFFFNTDLQTAVTLTDLSFILDEKLEVMLDNFVKVAMADLLTFANEGRSKFAENFANQARSDG